MADDKIKVLFVCLGNICRSPMCEAVFKHIVKKQGLESRFEVDSAGTSAYHIGNPPDSRSADTCRKHGVEISHSARQVTSGDFTYYDYILCMDKNNLADLKSIRPKNSKAVLKLFGEYDPMGELIIADPYYGASSGFEHNYQQSIRCSESFLTSLFKN
ncbi:phosphotyrosine protein phosphatase I superfamily [Paraphysoderma sedebokerense]|nr:phosphotyrosine protein phosphatase I superfamily [Paraphysoderma sedebokerense]